MKRYVITSIKKDGIRHMAFDNNHLNTYETKEEADKRLNDVLTNNNPDDIKNHVGTDLKVMEVECYPGGDSTRTVF